METASSGDTPITELKHHGASWHQTKPLQDNGIDTVEQFAALAAEHTSDPDHSALAAMAGVGPRRIAILTDALRAWSATRRD